MISLRALLIGTALFLSAIMGNGLQAADAPPMPMAPSIVDLVNRVKPSIAVITFDGRDGDRQGLGTGFIVDRNGLVATNLHVIGEARPIRIQLHDGRSFEVTAVEATDRHHDLALLRINAQDLPALELGDSDTLQEGESVIAVGNPLGLERSVVTGVISGRRDVDDRPMLQIAMPIERGNSGGPLIDMQGRVQGVITLKSLKSQNLGFAGPINQLKPLLSDPNPVPMSQWLTIGVLDADEWTPLAGGRWKQRSGHVLVEGAGQGFGGRCLCLSTAPLPGETYEVAVEVKFTPQDGAAGLVFAADGGDKHYGFYPSNGELRLSRFDGPDVYAWQVLAQVSSPAYDPEGWNHLKVRVEAGRIRCYINDELLIESNDMTYRMGRVGLCKFRQTSAEFRGFKIGETLPSSRPTKELLEQIASVADDLPLKGPAKPETIAALAPAGLPGLQALERQARQLEARAARVRQLAAAVHEARIMEAFTKAIDHSDADIDLLRAALWIAAIDNPELDIENYVQVVERMAKRIRESLPQDADAMARLAALKQELFEKQGYHGSRHDYDHRSNSYLNEVIDDREGIPITLSVLFMEVGRRLELPIVGIGLPGHFVVRYQPADGPGQLIDVFDRGQDLSVENAKAKALDATSGDWEESYLDAMPKRLILVRMLRNLFSEARSAEDTERMLRYTNLVLVLEPDSASDRFYRAVLCLQSDRLDTAREDVDWLLSTDQDAIPRRTVEDLSRAVDRARNPQ
ncbi:trypsin-like serine protease [bacterium]|nr:trypsin-like serine protease [bacterium]